MPFTDDTGMEIRNKTDLEADIAALMAEPLTQRLSAEGPQILIIHTHGTEAYLPAAGEEYTPSDPYRTTDPERSVIRVGDVLCSVLEEYGLRVLHDRTLYDYPSYTGSTSAPQRPSRRTSPSIRTSRSCWMSTATPSATNRPSIRPAPPEAAWRR